MVCLAGAPAPFSGIGGAGTGGGVIAAGGAEDVSTAGAKDSAGGRTTDSLRVLELRTGIGSLAVSTAES